MISFDAVKEELDSIAKRDGLVTPDAVIAAARDEGSAMHDWFNWDIEEAAQEHWRAQARSLIRNVRILVRYEETTISVPKYVRDPDVPNRQQGYKPLMEIKGDTRHEVLVREVSRISDGLHRARNLAKAFNLEGDVDTLIEATLGLQQRIGDARVT